MDSLSIRLKDSKTYGDLLSYVQQRQTPVAITGVGAVQKAFICHALFKDTNKKILVIAPDEEAAKTLVENMTAFYKKGIVYFPPRELSLFTVEARSKELEFERLSALSKIAENDFYAVVTTPEAMCQYTIAKERLVKGNFSLKIGQTVVLKDLIEKLHNNGYTRCDIVEGNGQYAVRGGIVDIFPISSDLPVRIEFWGDEIDSMGEFDVSSQRRIQNVKRVDINPAAELFITDAEVKVIVEKLEKIINKNNKKGIDLSSIFHDLEAIKTGTEINLDRYIPLCREQPDTLFDYISDMLICVADEDKVNNSLKNFFTLLNEDISSGLERGIITKETADIVISKTEYSGRIGKLPLIYLDNLSHSYKEIKPKGIFGFNTKQLASVSGDLSFLCDDTENYIESKYSVVIAVPNKSRGEVLQRALSERKIKAAYYNTLPESFGNVVCITAAKLSGGIELPDIKLVILSDRDAAVIKKKKIKKLPKNTERIKTYNDLNIGDFVVHINHGVGQYLGIEKLTVQGITKDYIKIRYAGTDMLYIPANQLDLISKYISSDAERAVKLSKIGGTDWARTKARVKKAVADMADSLLKLYAHRQKIRGHAFMPDTEWQKEFEERFEFDETDDQLRSADEIKKDMEKPVPMDRLLCGDVGFGKTEVALRGVFKCVHEGKQAAILVPTTILAWQHYQTVIKRFSGIPVNVEVLSRYRTKKQQEEIARRLRRGEIDIVIGTHRLIQNDIKFKDLGLVIVDEEQRFGVVHKEKLKELTKNVDILTLSATPIPRTLNMALTGIRDMSLIEEPPKDRMPVSTYVIEYDFGMLCEAMRQELRRGGQVFYLHNRVESIQSAAAKIQNAIPDKTVSFAHGKMSEKELSDIWNDVVAGEIDILVCTTIIETGIDVSNANTLIIEDADRLGLSQLYQLRGRVGRSHRRASCYLTYRRGKTLTEEAEKRLSAIREFTEFGSGFKIAMRDLEIRGAGNILGAEQHGHMEAVGYDLYVRLLDEAVKLQKGEIVNERKECLFDISLSAHIPFDYIENSASRIDIYKKIALIQNTDDLIDLQDELTDRFGEIPDEVYALCQIALLRNMATSLSIEEITEKDNRGIITADNIDLEDLSKLSAIFEGKLTYIPSPKPIITIVPRRNLTVVDEIEHFLVAYYDLKNQGEMQDVGKGI